MGGSRLLIDPKLLENIDLNPIFDKESIVFRGIILLRMLLLRLLNIIILLRHYFNGTRR